MDIAISSLTRLKNSGLPGNTYRIEREINQNEENYNLPLIGETSLSQGSEVNVDIISLDKKHEINII